MPEMRVNHGQTLAKVPIFSGLTEGEIAFLLQRAVPRHYAAGEIVFGEGEPCLGLYVVESGHIRIFKSSSGGREHVLSVDGPGSSVAELPVFDGGNYPASVGSRFNLGTRVRWFCRCRTTRLQRDGSKIDYRGLKCPQNSDKLEKDRYNLPFVCLSPQKIGRGRTSTRC